jgi:hypothetical protein
MKKVFKFSCIAIVVGLFAACSSGNEKATDSTKDSVVVKEDFKKAEVLDQIAIKAKPAETYALYLPSNYDVSKKYPVIITFDPHADGKLPVSKYKDLAEKYGYILVGSNVSKNGIPWTESSYIANNVYTDVLQRFSIDSQRVYLMGFSGGARVANGATIIHAGIAGVICCGAAYPAINSENPRNNYVYLGIVGLNDFNYSEMRKYDLIDLAGHNLKHGLVTFDGKHEWPPVEVMNEGFLYFEFQNMRKDLKSKNDALINTYYQPRVKMLDSLMAAKSSYQAYQLCRQTINFYDAMVDLKPFYDAYKLLKKDPAVDKGLQQEEQLMQDEDRAKQQYTQFFQTKDISWWQKETITLTQKAAGKDIAERQKANRMLAYFSLVAYMQTGGALSQNNIPVAEKFSQIYLIVDPTNSEAHYLNAVLKAKQNNSAEAIAALNKAIENGFVDKARLQNDPAFTSLKSEKKFEEVTSKLK